MTTSFSRIQEMTGQQRPSSLTSSLKLPVSRSRSRRRWWAALGRIHGMPALGTAKEWLEAALGDLENRETEPDVEQEGLMIGIPSDLMDAVAETRAGMKQLNVNLEHVVELLEQLIEIQRDEMRRIS
ncbi:MAG: hypothetical protein QOF47_58 [Mycobacterium sp.]|jgi:hypothetical protein|nr:hypothetical protein [Mycobacterium sp.]MDT5332123.1 hypothetical protein [Mycobacterium sp.]